VKVPPMPPALRGWTTQTQTIRIWPSRARDRVLVGMVNGETGVFLVMTIETVVAKADTTKGPIGVVEALLDDHAHAVLGTRKTLAGAQALAERYAAKWLAGAKKSAACPCAPIKITKRNASQKAA
jgi:hypothetical protein